MSAVSKRNVAKENKKSCGGTDCAASTTKIKNNPIIVTKFGGTPMASSENIEKVIGMVLKNPKRKIVVVSAPGKRPDGGPKVAELLANASKKNLPDNRKVTDLLISAAESASKSEERAKVVREIISRFAEIADNTGAGTDMLEDAVHDLEKRLASKAAKVERLDAIKAYGEEWSARILAKALVNRGVKAKYIDPKEAGIVVTPQFGNSQPEEVTFKNIKKYAGTKEILVVPGFYGYTKDGRIATFSRGGSDLTGSLFAAAVNAEVYENFSDVPGIFVADPKIADKPKPDIIKKLTFRELRELAYSGFSVFHDEAVQPILKYAPNVPIHVRHFAYPDLQGTWIVMQRRAVKHEVAGIAVDFGFVSINVEKHLMNREIGFGRRLLQIFEDHGLSYEHSPSSIDSISVVLRMKKIEQEQLLDNIVKRIAKEFNPDNIRVEKDLAMICIVGEGMKASVGIAANATEAISAAGVNIEMITQGASEISIVFGVKDKGAKDAVRSLYKKLVLGRKKSAKKR